MTLLNIPRQLFECMADPAATISQSQETTGIEQLSAKVKGYNSIWSSLRFSNKAGEVFCGLFFYSTEKDMVSSRDFFSIVADATTEKDDTKKDTNGFSITFGFAFPPTPRYFDPRSEECQIITEHLRLVRESTLLAYEEDEARKSLAVECPPPFQQEAPTCPNCEYTTVRVGAIYKCLNCGEILGAS